MNQRSDIVGTAELTLQSRKHVPVKRQPIKAPSMI